MRFARRFLSREAGRAFVALGIIALTPLAASSQYFGRNKVQYDRFNFRIMPTEHFRILFYPAESLATADAARMSERWFHRHNALLGISFESNPLIFYADPPDFQQSNVIEGLIEQGTGGVTEGAQDRVIMPFTGVYASTDHVLGHEIVHVFQYRIAESMEGGLSNLNKIPLWLIEGMAEYLSLGRDDPNTAMWLRDAMRRNDLPTINQLTTDPRYFPYRYGQALWAYIGGTYGDQAVNRVYRLALERGFEAALRGVTALSSDSLSLRWHEAIRAEYGPLMAGRSAPEEVGRRIIGGGREREQNISPAVSPDGRYVAFFSSRGLFGMDLYVADARTGEVLRQLTSVTTNPHFDALSFISSAGSWSPDGRQIAVVVYVDGDNAIDVLDAESGKRVRRIKVSGIGAIADPAWSPDGNRIAFSGQRGGISDLYVFDLASGQTLQLTDDREAQIHPAWSPDGRVLAFATDAGPDTDFNVLRFGRMRIGLMDVDTRRVSFMPDFGQGKQINPQFAPDGRTLYFISDQDGVSDIYRASLAGGDLLRLTRIATGVSGITSLSPALSVAPRTGDVLFSVFDRAGYAIHTLPAATIGAAVTPSPAPVAGILPPATAQPASDVSRQLADATAGLPPATPLEVTPYSSGLRLNYVGGPSVGVGFGGGFGTGLVGGVALSFSDMLGNHVLDAIVQAQGEIKDLGAEALYLNRTGRLNWGFEAGHVPYITGFVNFANVPVNVGGEAVLGTVYTRFLRRTFFDNVGVITQYPFSLTRRLEFGAGFQRVSFNTEVDSIVVVGNTILHESRHSIPDEAPLNFATGSAAFVGDYSFFGFTSPVAGGRYRFELAPYLGTLNFGTALADYRRYIFMRPFTLAIRAAHYGRYGSDAESTRLQPLYVGQAPLIRGYDVGSFSIDECSVQPTDQDSCPEFDRLVGSRIAVANVEFRIPLFGTPEFGLLSVPFLPTEITPFFDVGAAWSKGQDISWRYDRNTTERVPVFSAGVSARINLLGFAVGEVYWVRPFQRPGKDGYFGFQLAPGW